MARLHGFMIDRKNKMFIINNIQSEMVAIFMGIKNNDIKINVKTVITKYNTLST